MSFGVSLQRGSEYIETDLSLNESKTLSSSCPRFSLLVIFFYYYFFFFFSEKKKKNLTDFETVQIKEKKIVQVMVNLGDIKITE